VDEYDVETAPTLTVKATLSTKEWERGDSELFEKGAANVEVENHSELPIQLTVGVFGSTIRVIIYPLRLTVWQRLKLLILGRI
jgi:hypothetical protein